MGSWGRETHAARLTDTVNSNQRATAGVKPIGLAMSDAEISGLVDPISTPRTPQTIPKVVVSTSEACPPAMADTSSDAEKTIERIESTSGVRYRRPSTRNPPSMVNPGESPFIDQSSVGLTCVSAISPRAWSMQTNVPAKSSSFKLSRAISQLGRITLGRSRKKADRPTSCTELVADW